MFLSKNNVCLQMLIKTDSEFVHKLIINYDYVVHKFWPLFWTTLKQIVNTFEKSSGFVNTIIRNSDYCVRKFWPWFRNYDYVLVAAVVNLSTNIRPHLYQTPIKRRHLNVEVWFDQTSTTLRSHSDYIFINYDYVLIIFNYLVEGLFKEIVIISENKLSEFVNKLIINYDCVIHKLWLLFDQHLQAIIIICV